jgi:hypothetical protein
VSGASRRALAFLTLMTLLTRTHQLDRSPTNH